MLGKMIQNNNSLLLLMIIINWCENKIFNVLKKKNHQWSYQDKRLDFLYVIRWEKEKDVKAGIWLM